MVRFNPARLPSQRHCFTLHDPCQETPDMTTDTTLIEIAIPAEFIGLSSQWYSGMDMLYAVASTGGLTLGSRRPFNRDVDRVLTDQEWHVQLWNELESDVRLSAKLAEKSGHEDSTELRRFETFCEETAANLRTAYGLEDSDAV
jgi:hypothetical protein